MITFDVDQAEWGSTKVYPDGVLSPWRPDKIVIHYGGGPNAAGYNPDVSKEMEVLRGWQQYHIRTKGWFDIAYNYAVGQTGNIYRLRGENRAGATSGDYEDDGIPENYEARAVVWIGGKGQTPTIRAQDAMRTIIYQGGHDLVIGHRWVKWNTECPGPFWQAWIRGEDYEQMTPKEHLAHQQQCLVDAGYDLGTSGDNNDGVDGIWGPKTQAAMTGGFTPQTVQLGNLIQDRDDIRIVGKIRLLPEE